ncbi:MAG: GyrI-like domain-containing protein [Bacteroidota bacterium]
MRTAAFQIKVLTSLFLLSLFLACNNKDHAKSEQEKTDSIASLSNKEVLPAWEDSLASEEEGIAGVFEVPEMLSLCKMDSANMKDVSARIRQNFALIAKDMTETDTRVDKYQGIIYYNNDPQNFKFECFTLINKIPVKKPKHSQVVVLESSKMLVYNYYGPYENTFKAYEEIKKYCQEKKLVQIGQMREFYPLSQVDETDQQKWLTRIMVPVIRNMKK